MISLLQKYFTGLDPVQQARFEQLPELYGFWNSQINVISRKETELLPERHVLHSLGIAKVMTFSEKTKVMDVGTGGGFPGIPLAILFPKTEFLLVDSIGKKIKVVQEIAKALKLANVTAVQQRAEEVDQRFHFVVSRAVTEFPVFYHWVKHKFLSDQLNELPNGILYLKGGDLKEEFGKFYGRATFYELKDYFEGEFFETKKVVYYPGR